MSNVANDVLDLLRDNRDVVILALSIIVLTEAAIIILWARRTVRLQRNVDKATAAAQAAEAAAAKAAAMSNAFRIGDPAETAGSMGVAVQDGDRTVYSLRAKQAQDEEAQPLAAVEAPPAFTIPPAPPAAPAPPVFAAAPPVPAAELEPAPPAGPPEDYVNPVAERAAAWVLPEVEASRTPAPEAPSLEWPELGPAPQSAQPVSPGDATPTTLDWSGTEVEVQPADDFAVITEQEAVSRWGAAEAPVVHHAAPRNPWDSADTVDTGANGFPAPTAPNGVDWPRQDMFAAEPPSTPAPAPVPAAASPLGEPRHTGGDILLVEDDPAVAKLYSMLLQTRGYTVRHAADGLEGYDAVHDRRPDLVLLDIMMPRMNGIAFLQALRTSEFRDVPVVVLSNFMEKQLVNDALSLGAIEYMVKAQTRPEALVGALPHWLRGERAFSS